MCFFRDANDKAHIVTLYLSAEKNMLSKYCCEYLQSDGSFRCIFVCTYENTVVPVGEKLKWKRAYVQTQDTPLVFHEYSKAISIYRSSWHTISTYLQRRIHSYFLQYLRKTSK